jgi:hypothetical protein
VTDIVMKEKSDQDLDTKKREEADHIKAKNV